MSRDGRSTPPRVDRAAHRRLAARLWVVRWRRRLRSLKGWQTLIGAAVGFAALGLSNLWSDYLGRREANARESSRCSALSVEVRAELDLLRDQAATASQLLLAPPGQNTLGTIFVLFAWDERLRALEPNLYLLDKEAIEPIINTESLVHSLRGDLAETKVVYHTGDTFGVAVPADRRMYGNFAGMLAQQAERAYAQVARSKRCRDLKRTGFF